MYIAHSFLLGYLYFSGVFGKNVFIFGPLLYIDKYNPLYFSGVFGGLLPDCVRVQVGLQQLSNLHPSPKGKK